MNNFKKTAATAVSLFFAVLFSYASIIKAKDFGAFRRALGESPGLEGSGTALAFAIIAVQTVAAVLLCYRPSRFWGLWTTLWTIAGFAAYIAVILLFSKNLPCTCIGLFENMSWQGNLVFNLVLAVTALAGLYALQKPVEKQI